MKSFWDFGFVEPRASIYDMRPLSLYDTEYYRAVEPVTEVEEKPKETKERHFSDYRVSKTPIEIYKEIADL